LGVLEFKVCSRPALNSRPALEPCLLHSIRSVYPTLSLSFLIEWEGVTADTLQVAPHSSILGWMLFGGQATSPAESRHASATAKSGALPFLLHRCSGDMQRSSDTQYDGGKTPAEESWQCSVNLSFGDALDNSIHLAPATPSIQFPCS